MLEAFYATERGSLEDATINGGFDLHPDLVWIDLIAPSQEEQQWVLDAYSQNLPTLKSLEDISSSARFYRDDDGILHISTYFLTKNKNYSVSSGDVPSTYVVTNQLPTSDYGASSGSSGGGSFGIWGLLAMAGASVVGQYRRFVKKQS